VPYTPKHNGIDECKNHTLQEMENCMIQSKNVATQFCVEAINSVNYILKCTSTKEIIHVTLEEAWFKIKLAASHLQVFSYEPWTHILDEKHKEMKPKTEQCIFVIYSKDVKAY
jgi:hypothetical protein